MVTLGNKEFFPGIEKINLRETNRQTLLHFVITKKIVKLVVKV
jgi:hypothetical protein